MKKLGQELELKTNKKPKKINISLKKGENKKKMKQESNKFEDDDIPDLIILDKHKYQWILKGCKLIKKEYMPTSYKPIGDSFKTHLTISYESRSGSHIKEVIKGEIRDWNIDKIIGL